MVDCAARQSNATATARRERLFWRRADTLQRYREALVWWTGSSPPPKQSYPPIARLSPARSNGRARFSGGLRCGH
jgi:hypothetical protein